MRLCDFSVLNCGTNNVSSRYSD